MMAMDLTGHWVGTTALIIFVLAYAVVIAEEFTHLRKSKPVILGAGLIWAVIAFQYSSSGNPGLPEQAVMHFLEEFAGLFLFLLSAMTYVNAMTERNVFAVLESWLTSRGFSYRKVFWITGFGSFFISPMIDNLTTALVMCAVILAVGKNHTKFINLACINIVVGANAGGAFSPFGDITTLMVWQRGIVEFQAFFILFLPALANFVIPACILSVFVGNERASSQLEPATLRRGAKTIVFLFAMTIATAVSFHNFLDLPAFLGMMTGLAYLQLYGYYLKVTHRPTPADRPGYGQSGDVAPFDSFREIARVEWDTLLFFFGVIFCVGGLGFIGYLSELSGALYTGLGATAANVMIGLLSAVIDNIPIMVAVLEMHPSMDLWQWLLVVLTAGTGGSLLSIGSAAGVALMGQARGHYSFFGHLRWTPAVALGYALSIWVHYLVSGR